MGDDIFYQNKRVAHTNIRNRVEDIPGVKIDKTIYVFEGIKSLERIMKAPDEDRVKIGGKNVSIEELKSRLGRSLAIYTSLEAQIINDK